MKFSVNQVLLVGNLVKDPELRYTPSGTAVCTFGFATNERIKKGEGVYEDSPTFHNIVCWTKLAEYISQYARKGNKCMIEGRIQNRSYQAQDGTKRYVSEVVATNIIPFTNLKKQEQAGSNPAQEPPAGENYPEQPDSETVPPDDIPF